MSSASSTAHITATVGPEPLSQAAHAPSASAASSSLPIVAGGLETGHFGDWNKVTANVEAPGDTSASGRGEPAKGRKQGMTRPSGRECIFCDGLGKPASACSPDDDTCMHWASGTDQLMLRIARAQVERTLVGQRAQFGLGNGCIFQQELFHLRWRQRFVQADEVLRLLEPLSQIRPRVLSSILKEDRNRILTLPTFL